jgi:hypothetical protein
MFTESEKRRVSSSSFNSPQMLSYGLCGNTPCSAIQKLKVRNGCRLLWGWLPPGAPRRVPPAEGMQGTGAAFQARVSLKKQATDSMSHTPVQRLCQPLKAACYLQNPMVDPISPGFFPCTILSDLTTLLYET